MTYKIENEIKERARKAGLTCRELAGALNEPPGTTAGRLNGFSPLSVSQRQQLIIAIEDAEKEHTKEKI